MNFARHQEQAERTGRRLQWLHAFASLGVVVAVDLVATVLWRLAFGAEAALPRGFHLVNLGVTAGLIVGGAWLETARLREDGAVVARRLGAVAVDPLSDPLHRRLQNLLEELAIAARIGVPRAFVLEDEPTINALTAGFDRNHAVVVVTRGALVRLTRDELQGVIAHEISHIVNGDVRLNTRLLGLNHGLTLVAQFGRSMLSVAASEVAAEGSGERGGVRGGVLLAVPLAIAGAIVAGVGSIGSLAARVIQAGVGRQREYFADAQAVEFTRDRDGLGSALRKVGGQWIGAGRRARAAVGLRHPYWHAVSPLLLAGAAPSARHLDTHPPLRERVRRLYGHDLAPIVPRDLADPEQSEPELPALAFESVSADPRAGSATDVTAASATDMPAGATTDPTTASATPVTTAAPAIGATPAAVSDATPTPATVAGGPPASPPSTAPSAPGAAASPASAPPPAGSASPTSRLLQATRDPSGAAALLVALVASPGQAVPRWELGWSGAAGRLASLRATLGELSEEALRPLRWPLTELAAARLRPLSRPAREALLATVRELVVADGRVTLREWICFGLLRLRLAPPPAPLRLPGLADPMDARSLRVLFALVAHCAHVSEAKADRAANAAIRALGLAPIGGSAGPLTLEALERAVSRAARLPPLDRPRLLKHLVAILPPDVDVEVADFLRLLCVAIDCPVPPLPPRVAGPRPAWTQRAEAAHDAMMDA